MEQTLEIAITLVIAVAVALFIEVLKHTNLRITEELAHLLSIVLGIVGGMIAMYFTGGVFEAYVFIGITGAVGAPGIYDMLISRFGISKGVDK